MAGFTVDTHLLRELGELLVGRESTAVLELIKNAYDADASEVILDAHSLGTAAASIRVVDNGHGMTAERFRSAFLRIAGRDKEGQRRRSPRYLRRYTGQKGIGRLAAHKLAAYLRVVSIPDTLNQDQSLSASGVRASIDWDLIEAQDTLDNLLEGIDIEELLPSQSSLNAGTVIELGRLRSTWSERQLAVFVAELQTSQPPPALADPTWPNGQIQGSPLITNPIIRDVVNPDDPGFQVHLTGDFDIGEDLWLKAGTNFEWLIEIDALQEVVQYQISPLKAYAQSEPAARTYSFAKSSPATRRPRFQARIFTAPNSSSRRGPLAGFVRANSGVRVYLEGFRVLPYGEYGDDWLSIDREYRTGPRFYKIDIDQASSDQLELDKREALSATSNLGYFGAVFLTEDNSSGLRSLVNREGFVPDSTYETLVELVQTGIRLSVRVRRAVSNQVAERERAREEESVRASATQDEAKTGWTSNGRSGGEPPSAEQSPQTSIAEPSTPAGNSSTPPPAPAKALDPALLTPSTRQVIETARTTVERLRISTHLQPPPQSLSQLTAGFRALELELERLRSIQPDLRVLASVGLQLGAFIHDVNGMLGQAHTVKELLTPLATDSELAPRHVQRIRRVVRALDDLTHTLARQSSYLTDVLIADPRRRRSRIPVSDRLKVVRRLLTDQAVQRQVDITDDLTEDVRTPPMFPAEVGILLTNLLTNAVKNAGSPGHVHVSGTRLGAKGVTLLVHNTGVAVDLDEAERWFQPFESTTIEVNEVLGQGLGLGLPITRALVEDYRGSIQFVTPPPEFATSVRVDLPDPQERR
ncbi:sensor histidine kinase [Plantactinospora sp. DSM 117369]